MTDYGNRLDWGEADALAAEHGESFFLLDEALFRKNFADFRAAFTQHYPDVQIGYSYKTNYTPFLCRIVDELGGYAEVVSEMEFSLARRLGVAGPRIIFNGPYKARAAFEEALLTGATVNLDSLRDVEMLEAIAPSHPNHDFALVVRCNFPLGEGADVSRFGMDPDGTEFAHTLDVLARLPNARLKGLHCHFPDRDLDSFGRRAKAMVALMHRLFPEAPPEVINIGGGYFSRMPEALRQSFGVPPATFADYGACVGGILSRAVAGYARAPTLFLEPGTALVADVQKFYTRVLSTRTVHGRHVASVAGSIFDISPTARSTRLPVSILGSGGGRQAKWDIGGFTCIESDLLSTGLDAAIAPGDFAVFGNVGSYSVVMRPPFILPANPILARTAAGDIVTVKRRESFDDVFRNYAL